MAAIYPIRIVITTNWDTYFEEYCGAIPITIPEDFAFWDENSRYVLKIHGSIQNLSSIIATVKDYNKCLKELHVNGLVLIEAIEDDNNIIHEFPFLYLPNIKMALTTYSVFRDELIRVSKKNDKFFKYAKKIIDKNIREGMVVHHPPY